MIDIYVKDIVKAANGRLLCGDENMKIEHISTNSSVSEGNDLFVPVIGARTDAHNYIEAAFKSGCIATLTSRHDEASDNAHAWIRVDDTVEALHEIGKLCRSKVNTPAVGVTGSVGKTTTREMIACALSAGKKVFRTHKNYNSSIGLPITMSLMDNTSDIAVIELGMAVPGELSMISKIAKLKMAVLTNIGAAHIEYYGTLDKICEEKYTITDGFDGEGMLIINGDDPYLYKYRESTGYPYVLYGTKEYNDYRAENIHMENGRYAFELVFKGKRVPVKLAALGKHNVLNAAAALAAADLNGVDVAAAARELEKFTGFKGRLQLINVRDFTVIDDTYNASPASAEAGVKVLAGYKTSGRKIAVLGEMRELGENSAQYHYDTGKAIAHEAIDELITVGKLPENIARGAMENGCSYKVTQTADIEEAQEYINSIIGCFDVLYLKASNTIYLNRITDYLSERG